MLVTLAPSSDRIADWYPDPVPISSTFASVQPSGGRATIVMRATMYGWLMVWPAPTGRA